MLAHGLIWLLGIQTLHAEEKKGDVPERGTIYSPIGKRDPFRPQGLTENGEREVANLSGLEKYSVEQFQLRGILRGVGKPHAMFEDPEQKTYILTEGDVIGREKATISRIVNSEVILTQRTFNYLGAESLLEKVMSLPKGDDINADGNPVRGGNRRGDRGAASGAGAGTGTGAAPGGNAAAAAAGLLPTGVQNAIKEAATPPDPEAMVRAMTGEPATPPAKTP